VTTENLIDEHAVQEPTINSKAILDITLPHNKPNEETADPKL